MGFTFCVDGQAETLDVAVAWGCYERIESDDPAHSRIHKKTGKVIKAKVWKRIPSFKRVSLALTDGVITPVELDDTHPEFACRARCDRSTKKANA
ncbi:hypothetical protein P4238_15810 [Pseudomonas aeruginosa]|nr:hypothetical protein [Pseudomonas aeruginosa]